MPAPALDGLVATAGFSIGLPKGWRAQALPGWKGFGLAGPDGKVRGFGAKLEAPVPLSAEKVVQDILSKLGPEMRAAEPETTKYGSFTLYSLRVSSPGMKTAIVAFEDGSSVAILELGHSDSEGPTGDFEAMVASFKPTGELSARIDTTGLCFLDSNGWSWVDDVEGGFSLTSGSGEECLRLRVAMAPVSTPALGRESFGISLGTRSGTAIGHREPLDGGFLYRYETDLGIALEVIYALSVDPMDLARSERLSRLLEDCLFFGEDA